MAAIERHRRNATSQPDLIGIDLRAWAAMFLVPVIWPIIGFWPAVSIALVVVVLFAVANKFGMSVGILFLKLRHKIRGNSLDCEGFYYWKEFRNRR